jgi:hypothetical protein
MDPLDPLSCSEPVRLMLHLGLDPDPWQVRVLESDAHGLLLNCSRQSGKSTVVAVRALYEAIFRPGTQVLLISRTERQAKELLNTIVGFYRRFKSPLQERCTLAQLVFSHGSRIISLPCKGDTVRGYSGIHLIIIDEAARVPPDLYIALFPMVAVSRGRIIVLSTPNGRHGFFYEAWANGGDDWERIEVPAEQCPRIAPEFLERMRRQMSEAKYRQEFCCSFTALEGLVYPDFPGCVVPGPAPAGGRPLGGIDFGFRNPFAAVWGVLDRDGVLWLTDEHYARRQPLRYHAGRLPKGVMWYCDPSGAQQRCDLIRLEVKVRKGLNDLDSGIMAVSERLREGTLKVVEKACPNLLYEATLYRYGDEAEDGGSETPVGEHNHALDALRYLVSRLDLHRRRADADRPAAPPEGGDEPKAPPSEWSIADNTAAFIRWMESELRPPS